MSKVLVSFVHGYRDEEKLDIKKELIPGLLVADTETLEVDDIYSFNFPRLPEDFYNNKIKDIFVGEFPKKDESIHFKKLPRFGMMGLSVDEHSIYAATWNGIYCIDKKTFKEKSFISNRLINDPHGIVVKDGILYSVLTSLDLVVLTDVASGKVIDFFSINRNLSITRDNSILDFDWRFITKQQRGAVGFWHFNNIRIEDNILFLTSRLTSSILEVNLKTNEVNIRTVCWDTPVMIHDGELDSDNNIVFTSVDGKILICNTAEKLTQGINGISNNHFHHLMKRDLVNVSIRIGNIRKKEVNWCRGIEDDGLNYITTTEGRYDQKQPYFNITIISKKNNENISDIPVLYSLVDFPEDIRYMTGFSIKNM